MNTRPTIQTRRKAPSKSGFRILRAATRRNTRRKQRASTTADPQELGEVPGVGISLALVVILLLHVAAIGGIYIHENWNSSSDLKGAAADGEGDKTVKPTIVPGGETYLVDQGDNYSKLATKFNVTEESLRRANDNAPLSSGLRINIPSRRIESITPSDALVGVIPSDDSPEVDAVPHNELPLIQLDDSRALPSSVPGDLVEVEPAVSAPTNEPVLVLPRTRRGESSATASPMISAKTYTVKGGDTLWGISRKNGVTVKDLLTINGMKENSILKVGKVLKIPAR